MKLKFTLAALACALVIASLISCVDPVTGSAPTTTATLASIAVSPDTAALAIAGTKEITVTATYSDGTTATITDAAWTTSAASVATVDAGTITAVAAGTATITATKEDKTATVAVTVTGPVAVSAPTSLFKDIGLTYKVGGDGTASGEKAIINTWYGAGGDTLGVIDNTQAATFTLGSHPSGWSGAIALAQEPINYTGKYDFTNVATIRFTIKSADIAPANLTVVAQNPANQTKTLASLGVTSMTNWTQVTIPIDTLFTTGIKTTVTTALAFFWGSSNGDSTSLASGVSFQIGDIEFLNAGGTNVAFYSGVSLPPPVTGPSTVVTPTPAAADVVNLYTSSTAYTNPIFANWAESWGSAKISDDTTSVSGKTLKKFTFLASDQFTGSTLATTLNLEGTPAKKTLHISYFTTNGTKLSVKIVDFGAPTYTTPTETIVAAATITQGSWQDLELDFSAQTIVTNIGQLLFMANNGSGNETYWVDNIYFH